MRAPRDQIDERYEALRRARPDRQNCRIVVFGAAGKSGSRISREAAARGHEVVAVARSVDQLRDLPVGVRAVAGDVTDPRALRGLARDADALVLAIGGRNPQLYIDAVAAVTAVAPRTWGARAPHYPSGRRSQPAERRRHPLLRPAGLSPGFRPHAIGQIRALEAYLATEGVTWTYLSPPPVHFAPGERTGRYRTGLDHPVVGDDGESRISYEDFAVAVLDEIEHPRHLNRRFTVGY